MTPQPMTTDPVTALCERVRSISQASGEEVLRARREQAETLVADAHRRASADGEAERSRAEEQMQQRAARELQDARLEATACTAKAHWSELDVVVEAALREVGLIRERDPMRYAAALGRFFEEASARIAEAPLVVEANAQDVCLLREYSLPQTGVTFVEADVAAGIVVRTAGGNVTCDQSIACRRRRLDSELRLAAAKALFREKTEANGEVEPSEVSALSWRNSLDFSGNLIRVHRVRGVGFDELVEIAPAEGRTRSGQVLAVSEAETVIQVFEGTAGLSRDHTAVRFLGNVPDLVVSEDLLGRVFDGLGRPRDGMPPILGRRKEPLRGRPINPMARAYPREFIQTGLSGIDVLNSLVRGQKLPIFTGSGLPHNHLLAQVLRQARLLDDSSRFAIVFVAMGVNHADARFFHDAFRHQGVMERVVLFLNLADDPPVARLAAPRAGLTAAEYLAFDKGYHVLVILTDMTNYADALREIATARNEVPARKGYPGYLYSDLAEIYERAGRLQGREGSVTLLPVVTLPNDDLTHPVPDLTGYVTEGQLLLSRDLHGRGVYPPLDVLPSLSRLMKDGIGEGRTRDDHAGLGSQLYAAYAEGRRVRDLAAVVGEADLAELDQSYLKFAQAFENDLIAQPADEDRSVIESLDRGWRLLDALPEEELTRLSAEQIRRRRGRGNGGEGKGP